MSSVDFLVKLRDAHQMIVEIYGEQLQQMIPSAIEYNEKDFDELVWENKHGTKGPYQQTSKKATENNSIFQALQAILKEYNGFCIVGGSKYWFHHNDPNFIDRRKK